MKKLTICHIVALFFAAAFFAGCSQTQVVEAPETGLPDVEIIEEATPETIGEQPLNSYYYYVEAQLYKHKGNLDKTIEYLRNAIAVDNTSDYLKEELAAVYMEKKESEKAAALLEELLEKNPKNIRALMLYGNLNQGRKKLRQATEAYEKIISQDPKQENVYVILGRIYSSTGDYSNAFRVYQKLVYHFPASFVGYFYIGKIHAINGKWKAAEKAFKKTLALEPDLLEPRFELIELYRNPVVGFKTVTIEAGETIGSISFKIYQRYGKDIEKALLKANPKLKDIDDIRPGQEIRFPILADKEEALQNDAKQAKIIGLYEEILEKNPRGIRPVLDLALYYQSIGKENEAKPLLRQLGERSIKENTVLTLLIRHYYEKEYYQQVLVAAKYMKEGAPNNSDLYYISGLAHNELGNKEAAVAEFAKVKPGTGFYENAVINTALIYQDMGRLDNAISHLKSAISKEPTNPELRLYLGTLFEEKEDFEKAEKALKEGLNIDGENEKLHFRLGIVYDKWGRKDDCISTMRTVIRINPNNANALNYLGYTFADLGQNLDEAESLIKRALKHKPNDGYITDSLGWVYYQKGLYEKALEVIQKAVDLVPDDPIILEHLGDVFLKLNDKNKALEFYQRSLDKRDKDLDAIQDKIRNLKSTESPADE